MKSWGLNRFMEVLPDRVIEKKTVQTGTGEISHSRQIVITNLEELDIENLVKIRQGHWNIEMQHWLLDVQLKEDQKTRGKKEP